jgi:SAM-dependent methyltransferase
MNGKHSVDTSKEWFGSWFNSPYYHILYEHRDEKEAQTFINNLNAYFDFKNSDYILDIACGKGRHAIYLNSRGLDVVGIDLSPQNIAHAKEYENEKLHFHVHDMRQVFKREVFDYALNLFTSFGYFDTELENEQAIGAAAIALKKGGVLVIDFLNPYTVIDLLVPSESKTLRGIEFEINRRYSHGFILKEIKFTDKGKDYLFTERVKAIRKIEFMRYFIKARLKLKANFGDYELNPYHWQSSERMIFILEKA